MAYYDDAQDEEEIDPNAPQETGGGFQGGTISGQGSPNAGTGSATPVLSASGGAPSQFVGIKDYLEANKPQSTKLARDVSGYVSGLGDEARSQLDTGVKGFNQAVDQNTVTLNEDLFNQAKTDPNAVAQDKNKLAEFQKQRDATYKGPSSFDQSSFYEPTNQAVTKANQAAANTSTAAGQKTLLSDVQNSKKGKVHQGALAFDSALLQADPNSKNILAKTKKGMEDIPGLLTNAQQQSLEKASQAQKATDATKAAIQDAFTGDQGVQGQLENDLRGKAQSAINQSNAQAQQTMDLLKSGATPSDDQLEILDINRDQWNQLIGDRSYLKDAYGVNPYSDFSKYGTILNPETQINAQNIASADDYAKYSALNQLMGTKNAFLSDPTQAGTANLDALDFDFGGLSGSIQNSIQMEKQAAEQRAAEAAAAAERARQEAEKRRQMDLIQKAALGLNNIPKTIVEKVVGGTFICTELYKRGLISRFEYVRIHDLQFRSFLRRGRFASWYIDNGAKLVDLANKNNFDWGLVKKLFFDDVFSVYQADHVYAEQLYGVACKILCETIAPHIWDERILRNSYIDSLIFLPKILFYKHNRKLIIKKLFSAIKNIQSIKLKWIY